jgi:hypothetical protein
MMWIMGVDFGLSDKGVQIQHHSFFCDAIPSLLAPRPVSQGNSIRETWKQTPGFPFLVSPNAVSLVFPEETAGKRVSYSSYPQKDHLPPAVPYTCEKLNQSIAIDRGLSK